MFRKFVSVAAAFLMLFVGSINLAHAEYQANRTEDGTWDSSGSILTIHGETGTYRFGAAGSAGPGSACSPAQISDIVNAYPNSATRRVPAVGGINDLIRQLNNREYGDGIYWEFVDCGAPLGGVLSGLICVDFEAGYQDSRRIFEACANVTQVTGRRRIPVAGNGPALDRRIPVLGSVD